MPAEILFTTAYRELTDLTREIAREMGVEVLFLEAVLEEAVQGAKELLHKHPIKVIISRGVTAEALRKALDVPVVTAEATDFEILQSLWRAKSLGQSIGLLFPRREEWEPRFIIDLEEILGQQIYQFSYDSGSELRAQVVAAKAQGIEVLVGGGTLGVELADQAGMRGLLIYSGRRAVTQALQRAMEIVEVRRKDREWAVRLQTIIDNARDGIIALDRNKRVTVFNPVAEKTFGVASGKILGQESGSFPGYAQLEEILKGEGGGTNLQRLGNRRLVVTRVPLQLDREELGMVITFQDVTRVQELEHQIRRELFAKGLTARFTLEDIVGQSAVIRAVIQRARRFGAADATVLITGESGTGKEMFAQGMHSVNQRSQGPFVAVNCAALPETLLESELFGYEEGAFTGAKKGGKPGLFELAHGGTIFLDEIGKMSLQIQARLLRVLQEKQVLRVGGDRMIPVDVRVMAASNEDLPRAVQEGLFREDLYFRLNVLNLLLPPLRERIEDIELLVAYFMAENARKYGKEVAPIPSWLLERFCRYHWPGNVRELANLMERYVILAGGVEVEGSELATYFPEIAGLGERSEGIEGANTITLRLATLGEMEEELMQKLHGLAGKKSALATSLGISRTTLWKKLKQAQKRRMT